MKHIEVVESLMGNGKTFATLRYIEQQALDNKNSRWIYCTEYLSEIEKRTKDEKSLCRNLWRTPTEDDKTQKFIELLLEPKVQLIAITHALLLVASKNSYVNSLIKAKGYNLFLDETIELINPYTKCLYGDFLMWQSEGKVKVVEPLGKVEWVYKGDGSKGLATSFDKFAADLQGGLIYSSVDGKRVSLVEIEDEIIFNQFDRVILATYQLENTLFDAYLRLKGINKVLCKDIQCSRSNTKQNIRSLITQHTKYYPKFRNKSMSSTWWKGETTTTDDFGNKKSSKGATVEDYKLINNTIRNIGDSTGCKGNAHMLGFTVPGSNIGVASNAKNIAPKGYPSTVCFVEESNTELDVDGKPKLIVTKEKDKAKSTYIPCNSRACEDYKNKVVMVHAFSRYPMQQVANYLTSKNIEYSSEVFALNELLQWLWRSAIRDGNPITVSILSERMRDLFNNWLNE